MTADTEKPRLLVLAYYFPPLGMGGVQRVAKTVKYALREGWNVDVVTVKSVHYYAEDETMLSELAGASVYRTGSLDPLRLINIFRSRKKVHSSGATGPVRFGSLRRLFIPDDKILWVPFAVWQAWKLGRKHHYQGMLTTSPPHSVHLAGRIIKGLLKVRWVADFRDGWWFEPHEIRGRKHSLQKNERLLKSVMDIADHSVTISPYLRRQFAEKTGRFPEVICNGYDPDDFTVMKQIAPDKMFKLLYCGTLTPAMNPEAFLKALRLAIDNCPDLNKSLQLRFIGQTLGFDLSELITEQRLSDKAEITGYLSHREAVAAMTQAAALVYLLPDDYGPGVITGKLYEYMASGRPVVAMARSGDATDLLNQYGPAYVADPHDIESCAGNIIDCYNRWTEGRQKASNSHFVYGFNRKDQTIKLLKLMIDSEESDQASRAAGS